MAQQIQLRTGVAADWITANPILLLGEMGIESDTKLYKIGDGIKTWNELTYKQLSGEFEALVLNAQTNDPSTPTPGKLVMYTKSIGGRLMPKWVGPSGLDTPVQPALFSNGMQILLPGAGTALSVIGMVAPTAVGTVSHPAILAGTTMRASVRRGNVVSAATANAAAELRNATFQSYRGEIINGKSLGGFFLSQRFAIPTTTALQRGCFGLFNTTAAISTTQSPSALTSCIFAGWDSGDTNLQIMSNDASGTCTKVNLGSDYAIGVNAIFDVVFFAAPASDSVSWRVQRLDTAVTPVSGVISNVADLPAMSTLLAWHAYMNNGGTAATVSFDLMRMYFETDV